MLKNEDSIQRGFVKIFCPHCNGIGEIESFGLRLGTENWIEEIRILEKCSYCFGKGMVEATVENLSPSPGTIIYTTVEKEGGLPT